MHDDHKVQGSEPSGSLTSPRMAWGFQKGGSQSMTTPSLWDGTKNHRHSTLASISSIASYHQPTNQPLPVCLKGVKYGSKLSESQLPAGLGNSFSVPVFKEIAENMLKCFNGQKVNSDSEDSDSDSVEEDNEGSVEVRCSDNNKGSIDQYERVHTPVKKQKLSHYCGTRKQTALEAAIDEQADAASRELLKQQQKMMSRHQLMSPQPKRHAKITKSTPLKADKPRPRSLHAMLFGGKK